MEKSHSVGFEQEVGNQSCSRFACEAFTPPIGDGYRSNSLESPRTCARNPVGEHRLPACTSRQLAETGTVRDL